jgi:DNA-binding response OmpR family regulator
MRVGLLEDDIATQEMFLLVLQEEGYTAVNYSNTEECLADLGVTTPRTGPPPIDVLLIDWHLSGPVTGLGVIRQIRQTSHLDTLPIILTTAALVNATEMEELRQLRVALLEKPFSVDEVSQLIKQVTSTRDVI